MSFTSLLRCWFSLISLPVSLLLSVYRYLPIKRSAICLSLKQICILLSLRLVFAATARCVLFSEGRMPGYLKQDSIHYVKIHQFYRTNSQTGAGPEKSMPLGQTQSCYRFSWYPWIKLWSVLAVTPYNRKFQIVEVKTAVSLHSWKKQDSKVV